MSATEVAEEHQPSLAAVLVMVETVVSMAEVEAEVVLELRLLGLLMVAMVAMALSAA